jgi:hypothetical protein
MRASWQTAQGLAPDKSVTISEPASSCSAVGATITGAEKGTAAAAPPAPICPRSERIMDASPRLACMKDMGESDKTTLGIQERGEVVVKIIKKIYAIHNFIDDTCD